MVQVADNVLLTLGAATLLGLIVAALRRGTWRDPLAGVPVPIGGPSFLGVVAVMVAFLAVQYLAVSLLAGAATADDPVPGSDTWHWHHLAGNAAAVVMVGLMIAALAAARTPADGPSVGIVAGLLAAVAGWLIVLPISAVQAEMGRIVWEWLHPQQAPPVHVVLQALSRSEWGAWGTVQLVLGALIVAPLTEELFFRGVLLGAVCYHFGRAWPAIVATAVAFGLAHAQPQDIIPLISLGLVLGYLRLRCRALWPCIVLHVLFNARTMAFVLLAPELLEPTGGSGS
ncbi:MAG: CPBP family intramembrane glutamic endopeptidase [Planctomycetota bacterium]